MSERQHIWTISVVNCCNTSSIRDVNYVAAAGFDEGVASGKALVVKKWPNPYPDKWPECQWHPDYEVVGIKRGMELDSDEEEPA